MTKEASDDNANQVPLLIIKKVAEDHLLNRQGMNIMTQHVPDDNTKQNPRVIIAKMPNATFSKSKACYKMARD